MKTVDPERAVGKPHTLWVAFAKLYEKHGDLPNARIIFEKGVQVCVVGTRVRWVGLLVEFHPCKLKGCGPASSTRGRPPITRSKPLHPHAEP